MLPRLSEAELSVDSSATAPVDEPGVSPFAPRAEHLPRWLRWVLVVAGLMLATPLAIAAGLQPDPYGKGYGTHRQLGLPPCGFVDIWGIRCPSCGMTTSFAYAVRGNLWGAMRSNCGGLLVALTCMVLSPWCLAAAVRGRWAWQPRDSGWLLLCLSIIVVTLLDWTFRLLAG